MEFQRKQLNNQRNKDNAIEMLPRVCLRLRKTSSNKYGLTIKFNDLIKSQQSSLFHENRFNLNLYLLKNIQCKESSILDSNKLFNLKQEKIIKEQLNINLMNDIEVLKLNKKEHFDKTYLLEVS